MTETGLLIFFGLILALVAGLVFVSMHFFIGISMSVGMEDESEEGV